MTKNVIMARYLKYLLLPLVLVLALATALPVPVLAIADPDSPPTVNSVTVYQDLLETGDRGILIDYYLDYLVLPTTQTAAESYLAIFIDTDGITQLKATTPYVFNDDGYHRGIMWIYFTATEATAHGIVSANAALYRIWLTGNPTLTWVPGPNPPKTVATIDQWHTTGTPAVLLAIQVLSLADQLEVAWARDLIEVTAIGNRLTTIGNSYFENVIPNLRTMAPSVFEAGSIDPTQTNLNYATSFGAVAESGTATVALSPVTLVSGHNTINVTALGATGTVFITLNNGTIGTMTDIGGTVTGSPITLSVGLNTVTVTVIGTFDIDVSLQDTQAKLGGTTTGTPFDLTTIAAVFHMTRWMFSGLIWLAVSIIACAALYAKTSGGDNGTPESGGKIVMYVFSIFLIGGTLLGLLHPLVSALLFIAYGALIGYVLFFRQMEIGRSFMFMMFIWLLVVIAGGMVQGDLSPARTVLTADISATAVTVPVTSTTGFANSGIIVIEDEHIAYSVITAAPAATFAGSVFTARPMIRGVEGTVAVAHTSGKIVSTIEGAMLNTGASYNIAALTDSSGVMAFVSVSVAFIALIGSFMFLPLQFLGTELQILTLLWAVVGVGMLVSLTVSLYGGRKMS